MPIVFLNQRPEKPLEPCKNPFVRRRAACHYPTLSEQVAGMLSELTSQPSRLAASLIAVAAFLLAPHAVAEQSPRQGYTYYSVGDTSAETPARTNFGLMLMGGGAWVDDAFRWFVKRSGNGHIVILRASGGDDLQTRLFEHIGGVSSVETFVFHNRAASDDPFVIKAVERADGIFIAGGDQANYIRYWKGTALNRALDQHVAANKPLGGTSAGLAILGAVSYGALDGGSITSKIALAQPLGSAVTLDKGFLHLRFLDSVITDSHFGKRDRLGRLVAFLAKSRALRLLENPVGLGIDENTAVCIDNDGNAIVFTGSGGFAWLVQTSELPTIADDRAALTWHGITITGIGPESRLNLRNFAIEQPAFVKSANVENGVLRIHDGAQLPASVPTER